MSLFGDRFFNFHTIFFSSFNKQITKIKTMNFIADDNICGNGNNPLRKMMNTTTPLEIFPGKMSNMERNSGKIENEFMEFKAMNQNIDMIPIPQGIQMDSQRMNNDMGSNWVNEFNQMNLNPHVPQVQHQVTPQYPQQYTQGQQMFQNNLHLQHHQQQQQQQLYQQQVSNPPQTTSFGSGIFNNIQNKFSSSMKSFTDFQSFDNAFNEVEKDLQEEEIPTIIEEKDNKSFANIAQSVFNIMNNTKPTMNISNTTSDKFKTSKFMDLMQRISNKEVELDTQGEKLVHSTNGVDINAPQNSNTTGMFESAIEMGSNFGFKVEKSNWDGEFI